jgi:hypothetical protein
MTDKDQMVEALANEALDKFIRRNKSVSATEVVNAARPKTSPMHSKFEWNDKVAGERWREEQARGWIRSRRVVIEQAEGKSVPIRAFVAVPAEDGERYMPTDEAVADPVAWGSVLRAARTDARAFTRKLAQLESLKPGTVPSTVPEVIEDWIDRTEEAV